jgi:DNA-binding phage protein
VNLPSPLSGVAVLCYPARSLSRRQFCATATVGFTGLAEATNIPPKSLMRMFSLAGNPRSAKLFKIVSFLQHREGVRFQPSPS